MTFLSALVPSVVEILFSASAPAFISDTVEGMNHR